MMLVANVSIPNREIDFVFRSTTVELFFLVQDRPMAVQVLPPFVQQGG
jgi:hypothetical protein